MPDENATPETDEQLFEKAAEQATDDAGQTQSQQNLIVEALKQRGLTVDQYESDDQLLEDLIEGFQRSKSAPPPEEVAQIEKLRPVLSEYAQNAAEYQQWLKERQEAQKAQEAAQDKPEPQWRPPQLDDMAKGMIERGIVGRDEAGRLGVFNPVTGKYEYEARYAAELKQIEDFITWQTDAQRQLVSDPVGVLKKAGLFDEIQRSIEDAKKSILEEFRTETSTQSEMEKVRQYAEEHRNEYFETDENGQFKFTIVNGEKQPVPNAKGEVYFDMLSKLTEAGVPEAKAHWLAVDAAKHIKVETESQQETSSQQTSGQDKRKAFLDSVRQKKKTPRAPKEPLAQTAKDEEHELVNDYDLWRLAMEEAKAEV